MATNAAITELGASVGPIPAVLADDAERLLLVLPSLMEGSLLSADLVLGGKPEIVGVRARIIAAARAPLIAARLAFWFGRGGGWCQRLDRMSLSQAKQLADCFDAPQRAFRAVRAAGWPAAVRHVFAAFGTQGPEVAELTPELRLNVSGKGWNGFTFDPSSLLLGVPSPLAPCAGDVIRVALECPENRRIVARATVVSVRRPADAAPAAPAGFTLALDALPPDGVDLLRRACAGAGERSTRTAPRYAVLARAALKDPGEALRYSSTESFLRDYVTNLSHGGAFVRTQRPRSVGDRVALRLALPDGRVLGLSGTVVHRAADGVGLQLDLGHEAEASLSSLVASLSARARRVLIVDDDALARTVLVEAFEARGFETITAGDGESGLRAITDELFSLDAVVADVHMPGLTGEALVSAVRTAGGESDLVLAIVSASVEPELAARLSRAGADCVLQKDAGGVRVVSEVESALAARTRARPAEIARCRPAPTPLVARPEPDGWTVEDGPGLKRASSDVASGTASQGQGSGGQPGDAAHA